MLSKTIHLRPLKTNNMIRVKTPERAGRIYERNPTVEYEHEYKPILKTSYDASIYKYQKQKLANPPNPNEIKLNQVNQEAKEHNNGSASPIVCNEADFSLYKKKKINSQLKSVMGVPMSRMVTQEEFNKLRSTLTEYSLTPTANRGEEADQRNVYRRNLFVTKPFKDINKDFKLEPLVLNPQTISEETPYWFHGTAKFYTKENVEITRRMRADAADQTKTDIFGKPHIKHPSVESPFIAKVPSKGQRYELNRMVILEKPQEKDYDNKVPHINLKWEESPERQSYDRSRLPSKIGSEDRFIKKIKDKQTFDPLVTYKKIGESPDAQRIKQERPIDLKIGHSNNEIFYVRKAREDGFLANRKEITGENYNKDKFFV